jgi:hypothetical protein
LASRDTIRLVAFSDGVFAVTITRLQAPPGGAGWRRELVLDGDRR